MPGKGSGTALFTQAQSMFLLEGISPGSAKRRKPKRFPAPATSRNAKKSLPPAYSGKVFP